MFATATCIFQSLKLTFLPNVFVFQKLKKSHFSLNLKGGWSTSNKANSLTKHIPFLLKTRSPLKDRCMQDITTVKFLWAPMVPVSSSTRKLSMELILCRQVLWVKDCKATLQPCPLGIRRHFCFPGLPDHIAKLSKTILLLYNFVVS